MFKFSILTILGCLFLLPGKITVGASLVTAPSDPSNYLAVQFVAGEDSPAIKADGLSTTNGYVWVEKASPTFFTEFVGYDYPFAVHNLSAYTSLSGGIIEVGQGNNFREVKYFNDDWQFYQWSMTSPIQGVPEPTSMIVGLLGLMGVSCLKRAS